MSGFATLMPGVAFLKGGQSITVLGSDPTTMDNLRLIDPDKAFHQLLVHGNVDSFIIDGIETSAKDVAKLLMKNGVKKGTPIRCISCKTGMYRDGAAYQLSVFIKSNVLAPTQNVGALTKGGFYIENGGSWKMFNGVLVP